MSEHIFIFANLVNDRIDSHSVMGGEASFIAATLQILKETFGTDIAYTLAGRIGDDASGRFLLKRLKALHVDVSGVAVGGVETCEVLLEGIQKGKFIGYRGGTPCHFRKTEFEKFRPQLQSPGWAYLTSTTLFDEETLACIHAALQETPRSVFFDINWRSKFLKKAGWGADTFFEERVLPVLKRAAVLKGAQTEIDFLKTMLGNDIADWFKCFPRLCWVVETLAEKGAKLWTREREFFAPGLKVFEVQDTGAGDSFSAALLFGLARQGAKTVSISNFSEKFIEELLALAASVSAMVVQDFDVRFLSQNRRLLPPLQSDI